MGLRSCASFAAVVAASLLVGEREAHAATIDLTCDVPEGFGYPTTDTKTTFGFLPAFTVSGVTLAPDLDVYDPVLGTSTKVVGVFSHITWAGASGDPISLDFRVSTANRDRIRALLLTELPDTLVTFDFRIFGWDATKSVWYVAFTPTCHPLDAQLEVLDKALQFYLTGPTSPVTDPPNFGVFATLVPRSANRDSLLYQPSASITILKYWGIGTDPSCSPSSDAGVDGGADASPDTGDAADGGVDAADGGPPDAVDAAGDAAVDASSATDTTVAPDGDGDGAFDGGVDATSDATSDGVSDGGVDATSDAPSDGTSDGGDDATSDAIDDALADGTSDVEAPADASTDTARDDGTLEDASVDAAPDAARADATTDAPDTEDVDASGDGDAKTDEGGGCGCRAAGERSPRALASAFLGLAAAGLAATRRRRRAAHRP